MTARPHLLVIALAWALAAAPAIVLTACGEDAENSNGVRIAMPAAMQHALASDVVTNATATLSIIAAADGAEVFKSSPATVSLSGALLEFSDVAPGYYSLVVDVRGDAGSATHLALFRYRQDNVNLIAGINAVAPAGRWLLSTDPDNDADGDGVGNFAEIAAGLDPGSAFSLIAPVPSGESVLGVFGADMRAMYLITDQHLRYLGSQQRFDLASLDDVTIQSAAMPACVAGGTAATNCDLPPGPGMGPSPTLRGMSANTALSSSSYTCHNGSKTCVTYKAIVRADNGLVGQLGVALVGDDTAAVPEQREISWLQTSQTACASAPNNLNNPVSPNWLAVEGVALGALNSGQRGGGVGLLDANGIAFFGALPTTYEDCVDFPAPSLATSRDLVTFFEGAGCEWNGSGGDPTTTLVGIGVAMKGGMVQLVPLTRDVMGTYAAVSCASENLGDLGVATAAVATRWGCSIYVAYASRVVRAITFTPGACLSGGSGVTAQHTPLRWPAVAGNIKAMHIGKSSRAVNAFSTDVRDVLFLGDDVGQVFVIYDLTAFGNPNTTGDEMTLLGATPDRKPILSLATDRRMVPMDASVPAGVMWPLFVATSSGIYRTP